MSREKPYIVAATGGRDYRCHAHVRDVLSSIHAERTIDLLVHGGCSGADWLAGNWATEACVQQAVFGVTAKQWATIGNSIGPRRNKLMLIVCRPDLLVVFPGGRGTAGCRMVSRSLGIPVRDESKV